MYDSSMFVFLDETGCDRRDALRKFGYSLRSERGTLIRRYTHSIEGNS